MGRHHGLCGMLGGVGAGLLLHQAAPTTLALGVVSAGAAMLPDIDEPNSSVSHMLEPISGGVSWITNKLAGGHRQATHSLLTVAVVGIGTMYLGMLRFFHPSFIVAPLAICIALAIHGVLPMSFRPGRIFALIVAILATGVIVKYVGVGWWIPVAIALGWFLHILGDYLTSSGVPLFWPITRRHFSYPILGRTGSKREVVASALIAISTIYVSLDPIINVVRLAGIIRN